MTALLSFSDLVERGKPAACKGAFYRYRESSFVAGRGVKFNRELYPLKRLSCPGCPQCDYVYECFNEAGADSIELDPALSNGDIARLYITVDSWDHESGHADDWHVVAERSKGPQ